MNIPYRKKTPKGMNRQVTIAMYKYQAFNFNDQTNAK